MALTLALGVALSLQAGSQAGFADVWDRWRSVDAAWTLAKSESRYAVLPSLRQAAAVLFAGRWPETCELLDRAWAGLQGRETSADQAVVLRFRPPVAEPGRPARLFVSWAYRPVDTGPIRLRVGDRELPIHFGRSLTLDVRPEPLEPELRRTPELGILVEARIGGQLRSVPLSVMKSPRGRIHKLLESSNPTVRALAERARLALEAVAPPDPVQSLASLIDVAEDLSSGEVRLQDLTQVPYAREGATALRAQFPAGKLETIVIGVSGFGGESGFFENFGQGSAPAEAIRRGWGFVGTSASDSAVGDALRWVRESLRRPFARYFVLGFSRGAGEAMAAAAIRPKPSAMAILAPSATSVPQSWLAGPIFMAIGKLDAPRIVQPVANIFRELGPRADAKLEEYDGIEHFMLPGASIPAAFEFFDRFAK